MVDRISITLDNSIVWICFAQQWTPLSLVLKHADLVRLTVALFRLLFPNPAPKTRVMTTFSTLKTIPWTHIMGVARLLRKDN